MRAQATDYLMAVGLGILAVVAVGIVLWRMGYLSPSPMETVEGYTKVKVLDHSLLDNGKNFTLSVSLGGTYREYVLKKVRVVVDGNVYERDVSKKVEPGEATSVQVPIPRFTEFRRYRIQVSFLLRSRMGDTWDTGYLSGSIRQAENLWWNPDWNYRREIVVSYSGSPVSGYQLSFTLDTQSLISEGKMRGDCGDIRIVKGEEELPVYVENCNSPDTVIWFRTDIPTSPLYLYYGNPSAPSTSDPESVFDFFDNFDDLSKWTLESTSYSLSSGILTLYTGGAYTRVPFNLEDGYITEMRIRFETTASNYSGTVPELCSSSYTAGGNSNADATVLHMRDTGSQEVHLWVGDGSTSSYNVYGGGSAGWTSSDGVWYITGISLYGGSLKVWKDGSVVKAIGPISWAKEMHYIRMGAFYNSSSYDIQDTSYDWVRVRKYVEPEPSVSLGPEES